MKLCRCWELWVDVKYTVKFCDTTTHIRRACQLEIDTNVMEIILCLVVLGWWWPFQVGHQHLKTRRDIHWSHVGRYFELAGSLVWVVYERISCEIVVLCTKTSNLSDYKCTIIIVRVYEKDIWKICMEITRRIIAIHRGMTTSSTFIPTPKSLEMSSLILLDGWWYCEWHLTLIDVVWFHPV